MRSNDAATTGFENGAYAALVTRPTYWVMSKVPGGFPHTVVEFDAAVAPDSVGGMYSVICHYKPTTSRFSNGAGGRAIPRRPYLVLLRTRR